MNDRFHLELDGGEWLFREGDAGTGAFVIESGIVEISSVRRGGSEVLAQLGPGELVGEMALLDGRPRTASARALTVTRLRHVTADQLTARLASADPTLRVLLKVLLERYRDSLAPSGQPLFRDHDQERQAMLDRISLEQELELALENDEYLLHYQPIVCLRTLTTAGFEALVRWQSPQRGFVSPADFIPVAEESGLIRPIGAWVMREGCAALQRLGAERPLFMNVNLSGRQLEDPGLYDMVLGAVIKTGVPSTRVKLEVTESLLMKDFERSVVLLQRFRDAGFKIAVDDFGTGYSSLSYLHRFPVDTLKIDRSFIRRILDDANSRKIVSAIGDLAHALGMEVVAEGIETPEQAQLLRDMAFDYGQGYLFARVLPEREAAATLQRKFEDLLLPRAAA